MHLTVGVMPLWGTGGLRQAQPPGGTGQRRFDGTNFKPSNLPENAHAVPTGGSPTTMAPVLARGSGARRRSREAGLC